MVNENSVDGIREVLKEYRKELDKVKGTIKKLSEEEKRLKGELETVRMNLDYYTKLVGDMKRSMLEKGKGDEMDMFDGL